MNLNSINIMSLIIKKCTIACAGCSSDSFPGSDGVLEVSRVIPYLEYFSEAPKKKHLISGGEPTLHPDLNIILNASLELGYETMVVTNLHWVAPEKISHYLGIIPPGTIIACSYDYEHKKRISSLMERIRTLESITRGRNQIVIDAAYNGEEMYINLSKDLEDRDNVKYLPMQNMGRMKQQQNLNVLHEKDIFCPKWKQSGFVLSEKSIYYCLRGALNDISNLILPANPVEIADIMDDINPIALQMAMKRFYHSLSRADQLRYHHPCDICEALNGECSAVS